jgi:septal ring factor EnvC (AmiA/AmiB activator)
VAYCNVRYFRTPATKTSLTHFPRSWVYLLTALAIVFGNPPAFSGDDVSAQHEKEAQLATLRKQIQDLRESLDTARSKKGSLQQRLRATELEIGKLNISIKNLEHQLDQQARELDKLHAQRSQQQDNLVEQRQSLEAQIRASYAMGKQGYMKLLLNQQDPAVVGRVLTYYDYINRARTQRINTIASTLKKIDNLEATIDEKTSRLETMHDEQAQKKRALEDSRKSRHQIIVKLDADINSNEKRLKQLLQDEASLVELLEGIRKALANIPPDKGNFQPFATLKGHLPWPTAGRVTRRFGAARNAGQLKWHGVMINSSEGEQVKAIYHGRVAFADWLRGYGLLLIIDHGNGYMSLYGDNQSLYKDVGDWVEAGETIATVGNSGGHVASGLYFEIRHNGTPENPLTWCKKGKT